MDRKSKSRILTKGDIINDTYEVQVFIGSGAFGEVYRVKHKYLGLQVLKVFKRDYAENTNLGVLTKEAQILSKLTHPNIVRVFETNTFTRDEIRYYFITMGFVSGETLQRLLKRRSRLPVLDALSIEIEFLSGLKVAHDLRPPIIHRDISTDNILLSYEGERPKAMLSDFGLALPIDKLSTIPGAAGKYLYYAPECFWGVYLPASDVFSSGIVLYLMLTGDHPWEYDFDNLSEDSEDLETRIISARKTSPRELSFHDIECDKTIEDIIVKSLSKDVEDRYKNAGEFLAALKSIKRKIDLGQSAEAETLSEGRRSRTYEVRQMGKGFDAIAGMHELKETLYHDIIRPLKDPELYEKYKVARPNGMLLYGPPGCGKTFVSQKFAEEVEYNFVELKPSDLASPKSSED